MAKRASGGARADDVVVVLAWVLAIGLVIAAALGSRWLIEPVRDHLGEWQATLPVEPGTPTVSLEPGILYPVHGPVPNETEIRAATLADAQDAAALSTARPGAVVVNPSWIEHPRPLFPGTAAAAGVDHGRVQMECYVRADGLIAACLVLDETPQGHGFGRAAIAATHAARLRPRSIDGVSRPGKVRFSARFVLR